MNENCLTSILSREIPPFYAQLPPKRVRAIFLWRDHSSHSEKLVLIQRIKDKQPPYFVFPGGGIEPTDNSWHDALRRELYEELSLSSISIVKEFALHKEELFALVSTRQPPALGKAPEFENKREEYRIVKLGLTELENLLTKRSVYPSAVAQQLHNLWQGVIRRD